MSCRRHRRRLMNSVNRALLWKLEVSSPIMEYQWASHQSCPYIVGGTPMRRQRFTANGNQRPGVRPPASVSGLGAPGSARDDARMRMNCVLTVLAVVLAILSLWLFGELA